MAKKPRIARSIRDAQVLIQELMQAHLSLALEKYLDRIRKNLDQMTPSQYGNAIKGIPQYGLNDYKRELLELLADISFDAIEQVKTEIPKAKQVQLASKPSIEKLPAKIKKRLKDSVSTIVTTQYGDMEKEIFFQFQSSVYTTDDMNVVLKDLGEAGEDYIYGNSISTGAGVSAARVINETRTEFFTDPEVAEQIDALEFVNEDPVTPICKDLNGRIFANDDPEAFRYTPPLHWNAVIEGSLIETNNGKKPIENVKIGDLVKTHTGKFCAVYDVMDKHEDKEFLQIELENGKKIQLTGEHPVLTQRGWVRADELNFSDDVICLEDVKNEISL